MQIASKQDMTAESAISKRMEAVLLSKQASVFDSWSDICATLLARNYKGFSNQSMNGVLEWKSKN